MKRHPALKDLSREHHRALVLARALRSDATSAAGPEREDLCGRAIAEWRDDISLHFSLEERELGALSVCGPLSLRAQAERVRREHTELRDLFESLDDANVDVRGPDLGKRLAEHIRFEERTWFPGLEAEAKAESLAALEWRLQREPESIIAAYSQDDDGTWVAQLDCGHPQHIRHEPPFRIAAWATTDQGRQGMLGRRLPCPLCRMPREPDCLQVYKETKVFDENTVPKGLLRAHSTKANTWGRIIVLQGRVQYSLEDEGDLSFALRPGVAGIVAPERPHRIALSQSTRLKIQFSRPA